jgi:hypothetical protein
MRMLLAVCMACVLSVPAGWAQTVEVTAKPLTDGDIRLLRSNIQLDKNDIIAHTMQFTASEAAAFWPVYRDYARDQQAVGDKRVQLIKDYAMNFDSMNDDKATDMAQRMMKIDDENLHLRQDYWPKFTKALGAKRAAKFYQVDNRLTLIINVQLAAEIPLIP